MAWRHPACAAFLLAGCAALPMEPKAPAVPARAMAEILASAPASDWRAIDPENLLVMSLPDGQVVIELAAHYAPAHGANLRALAREGYFDGAAIVRAQDNFVVQWSRPPESPRDPHGAQATLAPEFTRARDDSLSFTKLDGRDVYADEVGFSDGFAVARNREETWLAHCYATVGAGRDVDVNSGGGGELYAVIGHAPRQLDRNITLVGRVVSGIELLAVTPRGTGDLGFYETAGERTPIASIRVASDLAAAERPRLEALRTDSASFAELVEARRNRRDEWYKVPAGAIDVCAVPLPVRRAPD
jgi:peptidylprolyl isomerase